MIPKSTRATAERCIPFPLIKERTSFTIKPYRSARVRPASFRRDACYTQRGGLYDLQDTSETTTKSWLRTLVVLGDQNRSQTIDRYTSGLQASGETRATHKEEDCTIYKTPQKQQQRAGFVPSWCSVTKTEAKPSTGTRQACELQARRVLHTKRRIVRSTRHLRNNDKELASYPRGAR